MDPRTVVVTNYWGSLLRVDLDTDSPAVAEQFPPSVFEQARAFHRQIPGYRMSPLRHLGRLADMLGLGGIWVKDESVRLNLNSFKVLGGSFAIYRYLLSRLDSQCQTRETICHQVDPQNLQW